MELKDTIEMMQSADYKERFKAEYYQTKIRFEKLGAMIMKYHAGKLEFTPTCPIDLLEGQMKAMQTYLGYLESRANIESVQLW